MAPPQLTRDTPVLNILEPLGVSVDPVFWDKFDVTFGNRI